MAKHRASTISDDALRAERTEAMNSFYHYEQFGKGRVPLDVFGKRSRDLHKHDMKRMNRLLQVIYEQYMGSPASAVQGFANKIDFEMRLWAA